MWQWPRQLALVSEVSIGFNAVLPWPKALVRQRAPLITLGHLASWHVAVLHCTVRRCHRRCHTALLGKRLVRSDAMLPRPHAPVLLGTPLEASAANATVLVLIATHNVLPLGVALEDGLPLGPTLLPRPDAAVQRGTKSVALVSPATVSIRVPAVGVDDLHQEEGREDDHGQRQGTTDQPAADHTEVVRHPEGLSSRCLPSSGCALVCATIPG
mmetsp:Transcript_124437/g.265195  ORF Transcript_124437/g.265195 Transcript_124437/m.265195 type:complete len:213 (+) Transcript_124437:571-1209(+)